MPSFSCLCFSPYFFKIYFDCFAIIQKHSVFSQRLYNWLCLSGWQCIFKYDLSQHCLASCYPFTIEEHQLGLAAETMDGSEGVSGEEGCVGGGVHGRGRCRGWVVVRERKIWPGDNYVQAHRSAVNAVSSSQTRKSMAEFSLMLFVNF